MPQLIGAHGWRMNGYAAFLTAPMNPSASRTMAFFAAARTAGSVAFSGAECT